MRQRNGAELFGANDPRSASIGIIDVAPEDDRQSILTAILTQDKLNRKQTVVVLPEQNTAIRRASDFKDVEGTLQDLQTQLVFVTPKRSPLTRLARQRNYQVFASLENYAQYAQTFLSASLTMAPREDQPQPVKNAPAPEIAIDQEPTRPLSPTKPVSAPAVTVSSEEEESAEDIETRDRQKTKKGAATTEPTPIILGDPLEPDEQPAQEKPVPPPPPAETPPVPVPPVPVPPAPPVQNQTPPPAPPAPKPGQGITPQGCWVPIAISMGIVLLALIVVVGSLSGLFPLARVFPGLAAATITITPDSKPVLQDYTIIATLNPTSTTEQAQLFFHATTEEQTATIPATGQGQTTATYAHGNLTFSNRLAIEFRLPANTVLTTPDGNQVINIVEVVIPPADELGGSFSENQVTVPARALSTGPAGNIPARTFDRLPCCVPGGVTVTNEASFQGGSEGNTYTYVLQDDIDNAVNDLTRPLETKKREELRNSIPTQEQTIDDIQCQNSITANPRAGTQADEVNVSVNVTCSVSTYNAQDAENIATNRLREEGNHTFDANYAPTDLTTRVTLAENGERVGEANLTVRAQGFWVFQFSDATRAEMRQQIAGKSKSEAQHLLQKITGVSAVNIQLSFFSGQTLPTDPAQITVV